MTGMFGDMKPGEPIIKNYVIVITNNDTDPPKEIAVGPFSSDAEYNTWKGRYLCNKNCETKIYSVLLPYENIEDKLV